MWKNIGEKNTIIMHMDIILTLVCSQKEYHIFRKKHIFRKWCLATTAYIDLVVPPHPPPPTSPAKHTISDL